jgi:tetratricopeptide (TPR) repeat protein
MRKHVRVPILLLAVITAHAVFAAEEKPAAPSPPLPAETRDLASRAGRAFASGNLPAAKGLYGKALSISPGSASLLVSAAAVETRLGNIDSSRDLLQKAVSIDLNNGPAWLLLGMNALDRGEDEEAFADLARAVLLDTSNPRAHNYLGMAAGRKGWTEAAETELRRAVELDPAYADANFNLAVLYLGRTPPLTEMARRHYQRALELGTKPDPAVDKLLSPTVATPSSPSTPTHEPSIP